MEIKKIIENVKKQGFSVYGPEKLEKYFYYTDGINFGYFEVHDYECHISTVHMPSRDIGTGFKMCDILSDEVTKKELLSGFVIAPLWATRGQREKVEKYSSFTVFLKNHWNKLIKY